jgi:hypothetical protein
MAITIAQICDAIEETLGAATGITRAQSYDELTEGIQGADTPLLQVYPEANITDAMGTSDRTTFGGGVRVKTYTIHADYYARQRSHIGLDMKQLVDSIDAIETVLEQQNSLPLFGLAGIKSFQWMWNRVQFDYGGAPFMGARFVLTIRVM